MPRILRGAGGPVLGLFFVAVIFGMLIGARFFLPGNLELIARQTAIVAAAALGMTVIIVSGGIDLSVGSGVALTTVVIALLLGQGWSPLAAALAGVVSAAVCGLDQRPPDHRPPRRPLHRHAGDDDSRARGGEGLRGRAPHRGAADVAQRSAAHHRSR